MDSIIKVMQYRDSINQIKVVNILDHYGWIGKDKIGDEAALTLFLVIQHADLKTQLKYLPGIREAVKAGSVERRRLALLEDRVALREKRFQIYGSQVGQFSDTKEWFVMPLEDPANVDKRRAEMGLEPLSDYLKNWNTTWDVNDYIKQLPKIKAYNGFE